MFGNLANGGNPGLHPHIGNNIVIDTEKYIEGLENPEVAQLAAEMILEAQIDKLILGIMFDAHRLSSACDLETLNQYFESLQLADTKNSHVLNTERNGLDVFAKEYTSSKKSIFVNCPICHKSGYDARKLSSHIETHGNYKRNSSLEARKRILASQVKDKEEEDYPKEKNGKRSSKESKKKKDRKSKKQSANLM